MTRLARIVATVVAIGFALFAARGLVSGRITQVVGFALCSAPFVLAAMSLRDPAFERASTLAVITLVGGCALLAVDAFCTLAVASGALGHPRAVDGETLYYAAVLALHTGCAIALGAWLRRTGHA